MGCSSAPVGYSKQSSLPDNVLTMEQVVVVALNDYPGQVDKAELDNIGERYVWRVLVSTVQGEQQALIYDALTGTLLYAQPQS